MFAWMRKLIDAVPQSWSPALRPARPNETILGKLPSDIWKAFLGSTFAHEKAERLQSEAVNRNTAHLKLHAVDGAPVDVLNCAIYQEEVSRLETEAKNLLGRALILGFAVTEAIRDHFDDAVGTGTLDIRTEGVVLVPVPEKDPFMDLANIVAMLGSEDRPERSVQAD